MRFIGKVETEVRRVLVGQDELLRSMLIGLLAGGHVLLEGVPGLAKSLAVQSLATALGGTFRRIQFTPDLLPSDLLGTQVYNPTTGEWAVREGPVFSQFLLADEINRAPAKVQSALLEVMQEQQVSLGSETHRLPDPFLVLATQNPVDQEGTYALPEAQVDRFMLKVVVGYPSREEEDRIVARMATSRPSLPRARSVTTPETIVRARLSLDEVHIDDAVRRYAVDLVHATRDPAAVGAADVAAMIRFGASPRASIALVQAARAAAFLDGRGYVVPEDIKAVGLTVLRHRVLLSFDADADGVTSDEVVDRLLDLVPAP